MAIMVSENFCMIYSRHSTQLATVQSMLIDGTKYNVVHFWKAYGMPNKD